MPLSNPDLTALGNRLGATIEASLAAEEETGRAPAMIISLRDAQALFSVTQELIAFRSDYPDVTYCKVIDDAFGTRGEQ